MTSNNEISFDEPNWLVSHHRAKELERRQAIRDFRIDKNDHILDIGCGPGLWTQMLAETLGEQGRILGIDGDDAQIAKARTLAGKSEYDCDMAFETMSFDDLSDALGMFDKIFFINSLPYCDDPVSLIRNVRKNNLKPGGQIIIRNWDQSTLLMHPLPERLIAKVKYLLCTIREGQSSLDEKFDDNFGRKIPGILRRSGFDKIRTCSQLIERSECDQDMGVYVRANGDWLTSQVGSCLNDIELMEFCSYFEPEDQNFIGNSVDFYLSIVEHTVIGIND